MTGLGTMNGWDFSLERLGLPHRRVLLSAGDTGFGAARCYDLEAHSPATGEWLSGSG